MGGGADAVRSFMLRYLELLGATVEEVEPDLFRVELDREKAAELEGDSMPAWMWTSGPTQPAQITYYFTFAPAIAERRPEAELVGLGSHRLQQAVESVRRLARATRAHLPMDGLPVTGVRYRPFYLLCLRIDHHGATEPSRLFHVAVDRVDGLPLRQLAELFLRLPLCAGAPAGTGVPVDEPQTDLTGAFLIAYQELLETLQRSDSTWATDALEALERERARLLRYFETCERDGLDVREERVHRLEEIETMRPRVCVRLQAACEAYLPVRIEGGSVEHLALQLLSRGTAPARRHPGWPIPSRR